MKSKMDLAKQFERAYSTRLSLSRSAYLFVGLVLSQVSNIGAYRMLGGQQVLTGLGALNNFLPLQLPSTMIPMEIAMVASAVYDLIVFILSWVFMNRLQRLHPSKALDRSVVAAAVVAALSQLIFTSLFRLAYEFSYSAVAYLSLLLRRRSATDPWRRSKTNYQFFRIDSWDLIRFFTPICISFPLITVTAGLLHTFYVDQSLLQTQLYRHVGMSLYFELGAALFVLRPLFHNLFVENGTTTKQRRGQT